MGNEADAASFSNEAAQVRDSFNRHLLHSDTATYDRGSQTAQAMPLVLGLVPENLRQAVLDNLVKDIRDHGDHVTAGDIGFHYVVRALTDNGRSDVLFDMLARNDSPSYGYQLQRGATTSPRLGTLIPDLRRTTSCLGMPRSGFIAVWRALMLI